MPSTLPLDVLLDLCEGNVPLELEVAIETFHRAGIFGIVAVGGWKESEEGGVGEDCGEGGRGEEVGC